MLITVIVLLTIVFWGGMILRYYKPEITIWFDNRYGPKHVTKEQEEQKKARQERREARWRWYG